MVIGAFLPDVMTRVVNVHWGELYLYVSVGGANAKTGRDSVGSVDPPNIDIEVIEKDGIKKAKLTDEYHDPEGNSTRTSNACLMYMSNQTIVVGFGPPDSTGWSEPIFGPGGETLDQAYNLRLQTSPWREYYASDHGSCRADQQSVQASEIVVSATGSRSETWYVTLHSAPVDFFKVANKRGEYLYAISAGDDIMEITINGLIPSSADPFQSGGGAILVSVYSTVRDRPTNLEKLVDIYPYDDEIRLSPDDSRLIQLTKDSQGTFKINIQQDTDPDHAQTDNYGKQYQPYKVTFDPAKDSVELIPQQPPPLLPLPSKPAMHKPITAQTVSKSDDRRFAVTLPQQFAAADTSDWSVQSINKTTETTTIAVQDVTATTTILDSVTYYNSSTGETMTVPIPT